jgi:hypothetical protein
MGLGKLTQDDHIALTDAASDKWWTKPSGCWKRT